MEDKRHRQSSSKVSVLRDCFPSIPWIEIATVYRRLGSYCRLWTYPRSAVVKSRFPVVICSFHFQLLSFKVKIEHTCWQFLSNRSLREGDWIALSMKREEWNAHEKKLNCSAAIRHKHGEVSSSSVNACLLFSAAEGVYVAITQPFHETEHRFTGILQAWRASVVWSSSWRDSLELLLTARKEL